MLRSKVFMKGRLTASGAFDKYKARLVAGGNRQDKELYDDIRLPNDTSRTNDQRRMDCQNYRRSGTIFIIIDADV